MAELRPICPITLRWCASQLSEARRGLSEDLGLEGDVGALVDERLVQLNSVYADQWNRIEGEARESNRRLYYFGTWDRAGHYWFKEGGGDSYGVSAHEVRTVTPFGYEVDGKWQPDNAQEEKVAVRRYHEGWTLLAWWDRSVDKRGGCCGALAWEGEATFETMVELLKRFPKIYERVTPLVQWHGKTVKEAKQK